jgi:FeoA-like protein
VKEKHPFDGPMVLLVDGQDRTISQRVAQQIYVRVEAPMRAEEPKRKRREKSA